MQRQESKASLFPNGLVAGVAAAVLILGGVGSLWAWKVLNNGEPVDPSSSNPDATQTNPDVQPPQTLVQESETQLYGLKPTEQGFELVARALAIEPGETERDVISRALTATIASAEADDFISTIPTETKVLGVTIEADGSIRVNLSGEFESGGGSASMKGRLAQALYTATGLDPDAAVYFEVNGQPLEVLGEGDGIVVDQPLTRADFEAEFEL